MGIFEKFKVFLLVDHPRIHESLIVHGAVEIYRAVMKAGQNYSFSG